MVYTEGTPLVNADEFDQRLKAFDEVIRPVTAELVGTTLFVFIGVMAIYSSDGMLLGVAMAHGITIALLIIAFGQLSGGHFNPVVTLGVLIGGGISWPVAVFYFVAQLVGGIAGTGLSYCLLNFGAENGAKTAFASINAGGQMLSAGVGVGSGLVCEIILTFILIITVLMAAVDTDGRNVLAPIGIGFAVIVDILAGGPISGASMNPARSFGPAVVASGMSDVDLWTNHWIYWVGPILGSILASLFYRFLFIRPEKRNFLKSE